MCEISVIIPVFNGEKFIKKCLQSINKQTYNNFEIIVVLNGTQDNTEQIINDLNIDVKIFKLVKPSVAAARNYGIKKSCGKYLLFFDCDDYMEPSMLELLYKKSEFDNLDLLTSDYYSYNLNTKEKKKVLTYDFSVSNIHNNQELLWNINYGPVKLFKSDLIKKNHISFPLNLKYEDVPFVANCLKHSKRIGKINDCLFTYVVHNNSQTTIRDERLFDIFKIMDLVNKSFEKEKIFTLVELNVKIIVNYTIQSRYIKSFDLRKKFINQSFNYLDNNFSNWKKCNYWKKENYFKKIVKKNRIISLIYCSVYALLNKID